MKNEEVNKRTREVEEELEKMKHQWINMYNMLISLISDTTIDSENDE